MLNEEHSTLDVERGPNVGVKAYQTFEYNRLLMLVYIYIYDNVAC